MFDIDYSNIKSMTNVELFDMAAAYLDKILKKDIEEEPEYVIPEIPGYDAGFDCGIRIVQKFLREIVDHLSVTEDGDVILFKYRGRNIRISTGKYRRIYPTTEYIDLCLRYKENIYSYETVDMNKLADEYSVEELEQIIDKYLDEDIHGLLIDESLDENAFYKECVEYGEKLDRGEVDPEDDDARPKTETGKKLAILTQALFHRDEIGEEWSSEPISSTMDRDKENALRKFDVE